LLKAILFNQAVVIGGMQLAATHLQVSSSYFSVKPVLECLQDMHSVPLAEELVYGEPPRPLQYIKPDVVEQVWLFKLHQCSVTAMDAASTCLVVGSLV
jgi:hypothetical protein